MNDLARMPFLPAGDDIFPVVLEESRFYEFARHRKPKCVVRYPFEPYVAKPRAKLGMAYHFAKIISEPTEAVRRAAVEVLSVAGHCFACTGFFHAARFAAM